MYSSLHVLRGGPKPLSWERWADATVDAIESKLRGDIQQYGWHVLNVLPERGHPAYSYSVGLFATFDHPEIAVVGLPGDRAHRFINNLVDEIRDGATFEAGWRYGHIIDGYEVMFVRVAPEFYAENFGRAIDYSFGRLPCKSY